jgi:hypothetical protein
MRNNNTEIFAEVDLRSDFPSKALQVLSPWEYIAFYAHQLVSRIRMAIPRIFPILFLTVLPVRFGLAQEILQPRPDAVKQPARTLALSVPKGTPVEIALNQNIRVKKAGEEIHGQVVQPVYAFDRLVIPAGAQANGRIRNIEGLSREKRVFGILNGDLTPARNVEVEFTELQLADGKRIPIQAVITPGSGQSITLVSAKDGQTKNGIHDQTARKIDQARQQARQTWDQTMKQVHDPGKFRRLAQYGAAQLPIHPQYLHAGTVYFAELQQPLDFGTETINPTLLPSLTMPPQDGSVVHALLVTPLSSATTQKNAEVEAVLSQPLFDGDRLVLPEGTRLQGSVVQVRPATRWHHNGQLRITFRQLVLPDGMEQKVVTGLESVQSGKNEHVKLDSEGGAEATTPRTRYASVALSLALTTATFRSHNDADDVASGQSNNGVAGGLAGFKLLGLVLTLAIKSQPVGMAMGAYGSARSVYSHFIAKGRDVVFPKNTPMQISLGSPHKPGLPIPTSQSQTTESKP